MYSEVNEEGARGDAQINIAAKKAPKLARLARLLPLWPVQLAH